VSFGSELKSDRQFEPGLRVYLVTMPTKTPEPASDIVEKLRSSTTCVF